jgi:hypothetical protein
MEGFAFRTYIPALNGEVLRANRINPNKNYSEEGFWFQKNTKKE